MGQSPKLKLIQLAQVMFFLTLITKTKSWNLKSWEGMVGKNVREFLGWVQDINIEANLGSTGWARAPS